MDQQCIFCQIAAGKAPATIVYETDTVLAFEDIAPVAPTHVLIIPRTHIVDPSSLTHETAALMADLFLAAGVVARQLGVAEHGYRLVMNQGRDGGQAVFHMHMHLLAGRRLTWPPG